MRNEVANILEPVVAILKENDGSLPDIDIDFCGAPVISNAYAFIRSCASSFVSNRHWYWSKSRGKICAFGYDDDPTDALIQGDADPFHVLFGGIRSPTGWSVPDLGVYCDGPSNMSLDYRMGPEWDLLAVAGLFEILKTLASLSERIVIEHNHSIFDQHDIMMKAYRRWTAATT